MFPFLSTLCTRSFLFPLIRPASKISKRLIRGQGSISLLPLRPINRGMLPLAIPLKFLLGGKGCRHRLQCSTTLTGGTDGWEWDGISACSRFPLIHGGVCPGTAQSMRLKRICCMDSSLHLWLTGKSFRRGVMRRYSTPVLKEDSERLSVMGRILQTTGGK
ncbi:hypothetical protein ES703_24582 [subsurface metagenome]